MTFSPFKFVTLKTLLGSTFATSGWSPFGVARNLSQPSKLRSLNSCFQGASAARTDKAVTPSAMALNIAHTDEILFFIADVSFVGVPRGNRNGVVSTKSKAGASEAA